MVQIDNERDWIHLLSTIASSLPPGTSRNALRAKRRYINCRAAFCGLLNIAVLVAILSAPARAFDAENTKLCQAAGTEAELLHALPAGILLAIGRVESGWRHPSTGAIAPWPWTINAAGAGQQFGTAAEALEVTASLRGRGIQSIDIGCFQINLLHHADAFTSLENAFDPRANADYAARFLAALRVRTGSWDAAVAAYHSATPALGGPYRDRVLAGWAQGVVWREAPPASLPAPAARVNPVLIWAPSLQQQMQIWTPSAPGNSPSVISIRAAQVQGPFNQVLRLPLSPLVSQGPATRFGRILPP